MLPITRHITNFNKNVNANRVEYIVIHDVGAVSSARNNALYFAGGNRGASAHYFIDNTSIYQIIDDKDAAWHCGDGRGRYGITNRNSLGLEICLAGDLETSIRNTVELTAYLMKKYNVPMNKLVRHYDASRKRCPNTMSANNWARWIQFKAEVLAEIEGGNKMSEEAVKKIVQDEIRKNNEVLKNEIMKDVRALLSPYHELNERVPEERWDHKEMMELNEFLKENDSAIIDTPNLADRATKGEVVAITNRAVKAIQNKLDK